jgi:holo-[acyl-carrier protein] synthase
MKGIGTDIVQVSRLEAVLARQGERFVERLLTVAERAEYQRRGAPATSQMGSVQPLLAL